MRSPISQPVSIADIAFLDDNGITQYVGSNLLGFSDGKKPSPVLSLMKLVKIWGLFISQILRTL